jgi:CheY-like chemotaxis protein
MKRRPAVLVLEDNPHEATLAEAALLFAGAQVVSSPEEAALAVLGRKALAEYIGGKLKIPAVAIVPQLSEEERERALAAGVRAVYERPASWQRYTALVGRMLAECLPTRKD